MCRPKFRCRQTVVRAARIPLAVILLGWATTWASFDAHAADSQGRSPVASENHGRRVSGGAAIVQSVRLGWARLTRPLSSSSFAHGVVLGVSALSSGESPRAALEQAVKGWHSRRRLEIATHEVERAKRSRLWGRIFDHDLGAIRPATEGLSNLLSGLALGKHQESPTVGGEHVTGYNELLGDVSHAVNQLPTYALQLMIAAAFDPHVALRNDRHWDSQTMRLHRELAPLVRLDSDDSHHVFDRLKPWLQLGSTSVPPMLGMEISEETRAVQRELLALDPRMPELLEQELERAIGELKSEAPALYQGRWKALRAASLAGKTQDPAPTAATTGFSPRQLRAQMLAAPVEALIEAYRYAGGRTNPPGNPTAADRALARAKNLQIELGVLAE